ncbi:hypothetical protein B10544_06110 [Campylobacter jejuni]|nr:hypothetical protein B10544_06110 [Campylobacter jejuni]
MNKTALTKTYTKDIQNSCLNSKKIVLSLATISFLASCTHATLTPEIKTYEEINRHAKARSASRSTNSNNNKTISSLQKSTETVSNTGNTLVIEGSGTITISNGGQQAVNFQPNSSTSTFLNKGTLIGGNNTASVQLGGANTNNGVTIETFNNQGIIGNGSSKLQSQFGENLIINLQSIILVIVELFTLMLVKVFILVTPIYQVLLIVGLLRVIVAKV